jgi:tetratricopeptide (TPR) repeat protein
MEDLKEAITCYRQALALRPHGHPDRSDSLNGLGSAVYAHFNQLGRMKDLEEAITCHRQALGVQPDGHPNRSTSLNNLGSAVSTRFIQLGRMEDLEEAITCYRQALGLQPDGHPNRSYSLNNLATAVSTRFEQLGRMEDLEEAITCYHQALGLQPDGHPNCSTSLNNLGSAVLNRFKQSRSNDDLLDAVKYLSEARNILPTGHPHQSTIGFSFATLLLIQCDIVSKLDESLLMMTKAFELFEHAADHSPASANDRFDAAVGWAREAHRRDHLSAVHAYSKSLTLLGRRLIMAPTNESQQNLLASVPKALALDAASSSINRGEFRSAIELLEQGRAILWSRLRGYRHPIDKLRTIDKELFDQFETFSSQLECLAMSVDSKSRLSAPSESNMVGPSFEAKMQQHRILSEKWDDVVDKIRQVDGFTDFLRAVPFATLQTAAAEGPIIIINISPYRSDAIILQDVGDPVIVPLRESLPTILDQLSSQFATACASHSRDSARLY